MITILQERFTSVDGEVKLFVKSDEGELIVEWSLHLVNMSRRVLKKFDYGSRIKSYQCLYRGDNENYALAAYDEWRKYLSGLSVK